MFAGKVGGVNHRVLFVLAVGREAPKIGNASDEATVALPIDDTDRMDKLFNRLDRIALAPGSIFSSEAQKQHYESELMYAFRKLQAARYHRRRVDEIHAAEHAKADKVMTAPETKPEVKIAEIKITMSQANHDYAHELAAFCAEIRRGMDFLTRVMKSGPWNRRTDPSPASAT